MKRICTYRSIKHSDSLFSFLDAFHCNKSKTPAPICNSIINNLKTKIQTHPPKKKKKKKNYILNWEKQNQEKSIRVYTSTELTVPAPLKTSTNSEEVIEYGKFPTYSLLASAESETFGSSSSSSSSCFSSSSSSNCGTWCWVVPQRW